MRHVLLIAAGGSGGWMRERSARSEHLDQEARQIRVDQKDAVRELVQAQGPGGGRAAHRPLQEEPRPGGPEGDRDLQGQAPGAGDDRLARLHRGVVRQRGDRGDGARRDRPIPSAVEPLIKALQKPLPIKTRANIVKLEAMKSLVKIHDAQGGRRADQDARDVRRRPGLLPQQGGGASSSATSAMRAAVPALIRGLFMTGRGADIFQRVPHLAACRSASRRCSRSSTPTSTRTPRSRPTPRSTSSAPASSSRRRRSCSATCAPRRRSRRCRPSSSSRSRATTTPARSTRSA